MKNHFNISDAGIPPINNNILDMLGDRVDGLEDFLNTDSTFDD